VSVSSAPDNQTKLMLEEPGNDVNYSEETVCECFRSRVGWLGLFLIGLWSAAFIIDAFEKTLQANVELAHFVPLIIGQGGNAGSQAVSSVIRAMASKEIDLPSEHSRPAGWVVAKESAVGALCGLVLGAFVLVVGVCCRVVTFHVGYRSSNTHHIGSSPMHAPDRPVVAFRYLVTTPTGRRGGLHLAAAREPVGQLPRLCPAAAGGAPQEEPSGHIGATHDHDHRLHRPAHLLLRGHVLHAVRARAPGGPGAPQSPPQQPPQQPLCLCFTRRHASQHRAYGARAL